MEIARHWRLQRERYRLEGNVCPHCDEKMFPKRHVCINCGGKTTNERGEILIPYTFSGKGTVYTHSEVYEAPEGFKNAPYNVAVIELEEGPRLTAQLTDIGNDKVEIGMPVEAVTRKLFEEPAPDGDTDKGLIVYGPHFRPV